MTTKQIYKALYDDIRKNGDRLINDKQIQIDDQNAVRFTHVMLFGGAVKITEDQKEKLEGIAISDQEIEAAQKVVETLKPKKNYNQTAEVKEAKKDAKK